MGGWASYKLAFEHPDDFAGALVLDGPVVCGVEAYPGANGAASPGPGVRPGRAELAADRQRALDPLRDRPDLRRRAGADHRRDRPGAGFDKLGQRYDLFIHTGADHLAFATEDRFGDAVTALGDPVRTTNPGAFTYDWYPSLSNSRARDRRHRRLLAERPGGARPAPTGKIAGDRRRRRRAARSAPSPTQRSGTVARHSAAAGDRDGAAAGSSARAPAARVADDPGADRRRRADRGQRGRQACARGRSPYAPTARRG